MSSQPTSNANHEDTPALESNNTRACETCFDGLLKTETIPTKPEANTVPFQLDLDTDCPSRPFKTLTSVLSGSDAERGRVRTPKRIGSVSITISAPDDAAPSLSHTPGIIIINATPADRYRGSSRHSKEERDQSSSSFRSAFRDIGDSACMSPTRETLDEVAKRLADFSVSDSSARDGEAHKSRKEPVDGKNYKNRSSEHTTAIVQQETKRCDYCQKAIDICYDT